MSFRQSTINAIQALARKLDQSQNIDAISRQIAGKPFDHLDIPELDEVERHFKSEYAKSKPTFDRMKSKVLHLCSSNFDWNLMNRQSSDWEHFNAWMKHKSCVKKPLYKCSIKELAGLISQLETIQRKKR